MVGREELRAPALIRIEVAAAITRKFRMNSLTAAETRVLLGTWAEALDENVVQLAPDDAILPPAIDIAIRLKHSLQDCLYLALAQRLSAAFITADETLYRRAATVLPSIFLLRHMTPGNPGLPPG